MHSHTLYGAIRPFGVSIILASYDNDEPKLYAIEPSGVSYVTWQNQEIYYMDNLRLNLCKYRVIMVLQLERLLKMQKLNWRKLR